jgi:hypothetical protein
MCRAALWAPSQPVEYIAPPTRRRLGHADPHDGPGAAGRGPRRGQLRADQHPGGGGSVAWAQIAADAGNPHKLFAVSPPIILVPLAGQSAYDHTALHTDRPADHRLRHRPGAGRQPLPDHQRTDGGDRGEPVARRRRRLGARLDGPHRERRAAAAAGLDARNVNYIPFSGGGEAMVRCSAAMSPPSRPAPARPSRSSPAARSGRLRLRARAHGRCRTCRPSSRAASTSPSTSGAASWARPTCPRRRSPTTPTCTRDGRHRWLGRPRPARLDRRLPGPGRIRRLPRRQKDQFSSILGDLGLM